MAVIVAIVTRVLALLSLRGLLGLAASIGITLFTVSAVKEGLPQQTARAVTNVTKLTGTVAAAGDEVLQPGSGNNSVLLLGLGALLIIMATRR